jgi:DNA-binding response OmpR family regulator
LEMVPQRAFDMILLDIDLTGLSGVETCRRIRELLLHVGIVMNTVWDAESDIVRLWERVQMTMLKILSDFVNW